MDYRTILVADDGVYELCFRDDKGCNHCELPERSHANDGCKYYRLCRGSAEFLLIAGSTPDTRRYFRRIT